MRKGELTVAKNFTIKENKWDELTSTPRFSGMGTTATMNAIIDEALGKNEVKPYASLGLEGVVMNPQHSDFSTIIRRAEILYLHVRNFGRFCANYEHIYAIMDRRYNPNTTTYIALLGSMHANGWQPEERDAYAINDLKDSIKGAKLPCRKFIISGFPAAHRMPEFALIADDVCYVPPIQTIPLYNSTSDLFALKWRGTDHPVYQALVTSFFLSRNPGPLGYIVAKAVTSS